MPETLITNDQERVRAFAHKHQLVAKAVSSGYITSGDEIDAIFTSALTSDDVKELEEAKSSSRYLPRNGIEGLRHKSHGS